MYFEFGTDTTMDTKEKTFASEVSPFGISKKSNVADDDHLLTEEVFPPISSPLDEGGLRTSTAPPQWVDEVDNVNNHLEEILQREPCVAQDR